MDDIFCRIARGEIPSCKVYEDEYVLAFLDLGQVTKGHTLVIPKAHATNILDCDEETLAHVMKTAQKVANALIKTYGATGVNILSNANESAGQSVFHFHVHIIPRYGNDEYLELNFKEHDTSSMDLKAMASEIAKNM